MLKTLFMRNGGIWIWPVRGRFGWIFSPFSMNMKQFFGFRVIWREVAIRKRPCRRDAPLVTNLSEVCVA
jgi:hypothetical protein